MSYVKSGLSTVAVTHDLLSCMVLVLLKKNSAAFGTVSYLNQDNPVPNCPNSYASLHERIPSIQLAGGIGQFISHTERIACIKFLELGTF